MNRRMIFLTCALGISGAVADDGAVSDVRSPGDMTVEERQDMMQSATHYNNCVYTEAIENLKSDPDIRRVADFAMTQCQSHLDDLSGKMTGWGFGESFATGFTHNVRSRAARKIIPELANRRSN